MPSMQRIKTKYTGVYYIKAKSDAGIRNEKIFYIRYRHKGKLIEKKVGKQIADAFTAEKAAKIRKRKLEEIGKINKNTKHISNEMQKATINSLATQDIDKHAVLFNGKINNKDLMKILSAIFISSSDGIAVANKEGRFIACNLACEKLSGIPLNELVGVTAQELLEKGMIDRSTVNEVLKEKKRVHSYELIKKTGKYLLITGTPVFNEDGSIFLVVLNERDVTQLNTLKEKLNQAIEVSEKYKAELSEIKFKEFTKEIFIAESENMRMVVRAALKIAHLDVDNVLLLGETGVGKGMLAKLIHHNSERKAKPFIDINCAAIPETLLEAELFGYEKGAFTGAGEKGKPGLFELANEGTLFLDEIGEAPLSVQVKLLKYLDDKKIMRLGGTKPLNIKCNIISATNRDLSALIKRRKFRKDLYHRLNVISLRIPPLRERIEDALLMTALFLQEYNDQFGQKKRFSNHVIEQIKNHNFPGNIRELKNAIKRAVILSEKDTIDYLDVENSIS